MEVGQERSGRNGYTFTPDRARSLVPLFFIFICKCKREFFENKAKKSTYVRGGP